MLFENDINIRYIFVIKIYYINIIILYFIDYIIKITRIFF